MGDNSCKSESEGFNPMNYDELYNKYISLMEENTRLNNENQLLKRKLSLYNNQELLSNEVLLNQQSKIIQTDNIINQYSSNKEKIDLFLSLFRGRTDVCAKRWKNKPGYSPYCYNDFKPGICFKPKIKCTECKNNHFAPLDEEQIKDHLMGKHVLGLYPLTTNDTCFLLVMDFDESTWEKDVKVISRICDIHSIPMYIERSRSGNGCHIWYFFEKELKASYARKFGTIILNLAMQESGNIKFSSYDRLFPSQDFLQKDGFGNLIALPLQKEARNLGNSVFIDSDLNEIKDQWSYLANIKKVSEEFISSFIKLETLEANNEDSEKHSFDLSNSNVNQNDYPETLLIKKCNGILLSKIGLSAKALFQIRKLASYSNPEFYAKQAMRQTTFGTPRMTIMYDEDSENILLPRGLELDLIEKLDRTHVIYNIIEERSVGKPIKVTFNGNLSNHQNEAFETISKFNEGVLSATTGFGKTVIGAKLIAERKCSTLILVHTKELANQWKDRLEQFLTIDEIAVKKTKNNSIIGQLGGGKNTLNGIIDIALMQSMFEPDKSVKQMIHQYGLIIVDECHHIPATNFSRILSATNAKYVYGLTATPVRHDGHQPIIFMLIGPIRYKVDAKQEALKREFKHFIVPRFTNTRMPPHKDQDKWLITEIYQHVCESQYRNEMIASDVIHAIELGRNPLVLTERTTHIEQLVKLMNGNNFEVIVLSGALKTKNRNEALKRIRSLNNEDRFVIIATGKLIGEGFDEARLDTLFMAMPIAWKGTIAQYAGRLHRSFKGKDEVLIYDYVDIHIPVLERMYHKRLTSYRSIGYNIKSDINEISIENSIYDDLNYFDPILMDIKNSNNSLIISSPYINKKKMNSVKEILIEKYKMGVRVILCIRTLDEYDSKFREYVKEYVETLGNEGIKVMQIEKNRFKFMIVDNKTVWYGGINILGGSYEDNSIVRFLNEELANELIGVISELS